MASFVTNQGAHELITNAGTHWTSGTIRARLCTGGTFNKDDTSMTGKTAATGSTDITLDTPAITKDTTNDRIVFSSADTSLVWTSLSHTGDAVQIAIYRFVTDDAGSTPLAYIDITDQSLTGATQATYTVPADKLFYLAQ
jgi:hypothetical protein